LGIFTSTVGLILRRTSLMKNVGYARENTMNHLVTLSISCTKNNMRNSFLGNFT